jgi:hypothetical protein
MAYCGPRGIPHSQFLGGPPRWTQQDREKALAWAELDRQTCNRCRTRDEEWDPARGGHRQAYTFEPDVCPGCEPLERAEAVLNSDEWKTQRGRRLRARRRRT